MDSSKFAAYTKDHTKMSRSAVAMVRQRVVSYYRALYDLTYNKNIFLVFFSSLFAPQLTFAKLATYLVVTTIVTTGVYAGIAPESFARTSTALKETVQTVVKKSVEVFIPNADDTETDGVHSRAGVQHIFCRGERRDAEDCAVGSEVVGTGSNGTGGEDYGNDDREDVDEVFCDGERRDAEDCVKRANKQRQTLHGNSQRTDDHGNDDAREDNKIDDREDADEVFCDGERRDAEDCAKRLNKVEDKVEDNSDDERIIDNSNEGREHNDDLLENDDDTIFGSDGDMKDKSNDENEIENDDREDADEVFCDGERRDAKDCTERLAKQYEEDNDNEDEDAEKEHDDD